MLKILIFGILAYVVFRFIRKMLLPDDRDHGNTDAGPVDEMVQDPVCLTYIPRSGAIKKVVNGETHFFCSQACVDKFIDKK
jgi:YHS domain-containing protein